MNVDYSYQLLNVSKQLSNPVGDLTFELLIPRLEIKFGELIAVTGASGSGKSTLLNLLLMISRPADSEQFRFFGGETTIADVAHMWFENDRNGLAELRRRSIGFVTQTGGLLRFLSVRHNIFLPRQLLGLSDDGFVARISDQLKISHLMDRLPENLAVGERQRVAIARAISHRPRIVIADEPTASLDRQNAEIIMTLLDDIAQQEKITLIIASHDVDLMKQHGFRFLTLRQFPGNPKEIPRSIVENLK